jgi:hypothetical protein
MDIQFEVQKIHSQFGTTEMANYQIQKLFDKAIKEAVNEALRIHDVVGRSEQLKCGNSNPPCAPNVKFGCLECTECNWSE